MKFMLSARRKLVDPTSVLVRKSVGVMMGATLATKMKKIPGIEGSLLLQVCFAVVLCMAARVMVLSAFGSKVKKAPPTVDVVASNLTFAWSTYLYLNQVIHRFLLGCDEKRVANCGYQNNLGCAVAASASFYVLVNACDAIQDDYNERHNKFAAKFGKLCLAAAPLVLGWNWKDFMEASEKGIQKETEQTGHGLPEFLRMATIFGLLAWFFHMYCISARTARRRSAPESNSEYEQRVLIVEDKLFFPLSVFDVSFFGDVLEFVDQTALQMMAWELKGVVDYYSASQPPGVVILVALVGVLLFALLQQVDKMATTPERWAVASERWKLGAKIHRRFTEAFPLGVGIGVSNVCLLVRGWANAAIHGPGAELGVIQQTCELQVYFLVIALLASTDLVVSESCGGSHSHVSLHVASLDSNKQTVVGEVFSGSFRDAYRGASEAFNAKRKAWHEGGEGAPVIGRLYGSRGRVLEEFSSAGNQWKLLDNWSDEQFHLEEAHSSGPVARAGEEKYMPLAEAGGQG